MIRYIAQQIADDYEDGEFDEGHPCLTVEKENFLLAAIYEAFSDDGNRVMYRFNDLSVIEFRGDRYEVRAI